jgi:SAM-dependent methyltransferase
MSSGGHTQAEGQAVMSDPPGIEELRTERMLGPWARLSLVPTILPALDGVADRLAAGTLVADVGCGAGLALSTLAAAVDVPRYELSRLAVERARARVAGLTNVQIVHRRAEELPEG